MRAYSFAKITVRPFLKLSDVNNHYIFGETKHVINMCDYREPEVIDLIHSKGGTFDWFPTEEQPMDVNAILQAVAKLAEYDKDSTPIIVHCMGGNNRSRTVVEAYYFAKTGTHLEDMYRGYMNHLHYNCESGYLPPLKEMEKLLSNSTITKMKHTDILLNDVLALIRDNNILDGDLYIKHIRDFFAQSPDESIFQFTTVSWDSDEKEFDFRWDTMLLDCRFSIGLKESRWHQWIGINHHCKDVECYVHGVGGDYYDNDDFADCFYDAMNWHLEEIKNDKPYSEQ